MVDIEFEYSVPVLVIGGGACGCIAALAAKQAGSDVMLIEQDDRPMGSTGMSQGLISAAGTQQQHKHGVEDSAERFYNDIMTKTQGQADPVIAKIIAENSGPTLDWMIGDLDLPWRLDTSFRPGYGNSVYRVHGWDGHNGQDMVDLLHQRLSEADIDVFLEAKLTVVHTDDNHRVCGVSLTRPNGEIERLGCDALILACGGFAANTAMLQKYIPEVCHARNNGHEGSQGTAVEIGLKLGAQLGDMGAYQGYGMHTEPQGISVPPNILINGGVLINQNGERFVDESEDIAGVVLPVLQQPGDFVWVVYDERIEKTALHYPEMKQLNTLNAAKSGDNIQTLAAAINVPGEALQQTLEQAHLAQLSHTPDAFNRQWHDDLPPENKLKAFKVIGAIYHTQGGLQINERAQVVHQDGTSLPNLFAGGGAARSVSGPAHWGYIPAMGLATAVVLGRTAGQSAAAAASNSAK
ncbi:MAG: FAD-dependent oxidoreductase [Alteromonadaceae bacterium]|nr:FAD-dependent oxidoreductase [Alteromonadaceae bacterium]